jgi:hypothetical protein
LNFAFQLLIKKLTAYAFWIWIVFRLILETEWVRYEHWKHVPNTSFNKNYSKFDILPWPLPWTSSSYYIYTQVEVSQSPHGCVLLFFYLKS